MAYRHFPPTGELDSGGVFIAFIDCLAVSLHHALALAQSAVENSGGARLPACRAGGGLRADLYRPSPLAGQARQIAIFPAGATAAQASDHGRDDTNHAAAAADRTAAAQLGVHATALAETADNLVHKAEHSLATGPRFN